VPKEFADKIRSAAIPIEGSSKKDPKQLLPRKVDYPVTDESFQLIGAWIDALQAHIIQGTGEMETEKDVKKERKKFQNE
jgi:hypothetical protein